MFELIVLTFAVVASIGPTSIYAIKEGLKKTGMTTFFILFGAISVDVLYATLAGIGLTTLGTNILFKKILLLLAIFIFIYLGGKTLYDVFNKNSFTPTTKSHNMPPFFVGIIITLPNPFTIVFWSTALTGLSIPYQARLFIPTILLTGMFWAMVVGTTIHYSKKYISPKTFHIIEVTTSIIFFGFALKFFLQII